jgi:hypothetical protein
MGTLLYRIAQKGWESGVTGTGPSVSGIIRLVSSIILFIFTKTSGVHVNGYVMLPYDIEKVNTIIENQYHGN